MELLVTEVAGLGSSGNWQGLRLAVPESFGTIDNARLQNNRLLIVLLRIATTPCATRPAFSSDNMQID